MLLYEDRLVDRIMDIFMRECKRFSTKSIVITDFKINTSLTQPNLTRVYVGSDKVY